MSSLRSAMVSMHTDPWTAVFVIAVLIAIIIMFVLATRASVSYPNWKGPRTYASHAGEDDTHSQSPRLHFVTEDVRWNREGTHARKVRIFFTLLNSHEHPVVVNDLHVHEYLRTLILQKGVIGRREFIELKQDNSILRDSKIYHLAAHETQSIELVFRISRRVAYGSNDSGEAVPGDATVTFGIFVDYFYIHGRGYIRLRIPSDSIFVSQTDPDGFAYLSKDNIARYYEMNRGNQSGTKAVTGWDTILREHIAQYYEIVDGSEDSLKKGPQPSR